MAKLFPLIWKRPESSAYPKVWHTFQAKDVGSDDLVDYTIEDLPESKFNEAIQILIENFCKGEPMWMAYECYKDPEAVENIVLMWESVMKQKMALACFKKGSDEIAGLNINFIESRGEHLMDDVRRQNKCKKKMNIENLVGLLYKDFDVCEQYGVDKYLTSVSLVVSTKYRGRGIGEQFLDIRTNICQEFGIKLTSTSFTSDHSNRIAKKTGFKVDKLLRYDDIRKTHPELNLPPIKSEVITIMSKEF